MSGEEPEQISDSVKLPVSIFQDGLQRLLSHFYPLTDFGQKVPEDVKYVFHLSSLSLATMASSDHVKWKSDNKTQHFECKLDTCMYLRRFEPLKTLCTCMSANLMPVCFLTAYKSLSSDHYLHGKIAWCNDAISIFSFNEKETLQLTTGLKNYHQIDNNENLAKLLRLTYWFKYWYKGPLFIKEATKTLKRYYSFKRRNFISFFPGDDCLLRGLSDILLKVDIAYIYYLLHAKYASVGYRLLDKMKAFFFKTFMENPDLSLDAILRIGFLDRAQLNAQLGNASTLLNERSIKVLMMHLLARIEENDLFISNKEPEFKIPVDIGLYESNKDTIITCIKRHWCTMPFLRDNEGKENLRFIEGLARMPIQVSTDEVMIILESCELFYTCPLRRRRALGETYRGANSALADDDYY